MTNRFSAQKGTINLIIVLVLLAVLGSLVWFFTSHKNIKTSLENLTSIKLKSFKDISLEDENYAAVEYLFRERVLERGENNLFEPANIISKREWVGMLVKLTGITPDENIYKNCFSDIGEGKSEAAICFAKEQSWLEGFGDSRQILNHWEFVQIARAQQVGESFNPDSPVKKDEATGSLSRLMNWQTDRVVDFAKERKIIEGDAEGNLTKGEAVNTIYRALATVPLKNDTYSKKLDNEVERYKLDELVDLEEKLERQRREEASYWLRERAKKYAEMFGEQAAAEIVAEAEKFDDVFEAQEAESKTYLKKAREKNYEAMLAEDKALGKETPTYNILEPLQKVFVAKGGKISMDDLVVLKRTPPHYDDEVTTNPVIKSRDGATIMIFLDENYGVISPANLEKRKYVLSIGISSFYQEGRTIGHIAITLRNFITGVGEKAALMRRFRLDNLDKVLQSSFNDLEVDIGQMLSPPVIASPPPQTPTPKETQNSRSKNDVASNDYSDGYFEFLDVAIGQPSIAFSTAQKPHIIVAADPGKDVRTWLPLKIEIRKDGSNFWSGKIDGDPKQVCRGSSGCSTNGPSGIGIDWKKIEIIAYDKNGKVVATFFETYNPGN